MSYSISISSLALGKIVLHAARYSHLAVNGVLLGTAEGRDITDAVPLFHNALSLTPMLDVALTQIEERFCKKDLKIVGYYQANENIRDAEPDFIATKICEKIAENSGNACLLMVDNRLLGPRMDRQPFIVSQLSSDGKWRSKDSSSVQVAEGALSLVGSLLERRSQGAGVVDFDTHLDDISQDWANTHLHALLS